MNRAPRAPEAIWRPTFRTPVFPCKEQPRRSVPCNDDPVPLDVPVLPPPDVLQLASATANRKRPSETQGPSEGLVRGEGSPLPGEGGAREGLPARSRTRRAISSAKIRSVAPSTLGLVAAMPRSSQSSESTHCLAHDS